MRFRIPGVLLALGLVAGSSLAGAQVNPQDQQIPPELRPIVEELQQVQTQLAPVQMQAMQDQTFVQEQQELAQAVRTAMVQDDPDLAGSLERLESLMREAQQAQASGDADRIQELQAEAMQIQPAVQQAEQRALEDPGIQQRFASLQERLRSKMIEIDPDTEALLDRHDELQQRLIEAAQGAEGQ